MLELAKEGNNLELKFDYSIPYGQSWTSMFTHHCSSEHEKELMFAHLKKFMYDAIQKARRDAYNEGWSDKASKRAKQTWFASTL